MASAGSISGEPGSVLGSQRRQCRCSVSAIHIDTGGIPSGGLWSLDFELGGNNGDPDTLYFTDGINGEAHGLIGAIPHWSGPPGAGDSHRSKSKSLRRSRFWFSRPQFAID